MAFDCSSTSKFWPPKIFAVSLNRENVKQWLSCNSASAARQSNDDHDYVYPSSAVHQNVNLQKNQIPSNEQSTTAARKSTLRKRRVFQERLVLLQWRENFVEIIFANAPGKNSLTPRVSFNLFRNVSMLVNCF